MSDEENMADSETSVRIDCLRACVLSFTKRLVPEIWYRQVDLVLLLTDFQQRMSVPLSWHVTVFVILHHIFPSEYLP